MDWFEDSNDKFVEKRNALSDETLVDIKIEQLITEEITNFECGLILLGRETGILSFVCQQCGDEFESVTTFSAHIEIHFGTATVNIKKEKPDLAVSPPPPICTSPSTSKLNRDGNNSKPSRNRLPSVSTSTSSFDPNEYFVDSDKASDEFATDVEKEVGKVVKCTKCEEMFACIGCSAQHEETAHNNSDKKKSFSCIYCAAVFWTGNKLLEHEKSVHDAGNKEFNCPFCEIAFSSQSELNQHQAQLTANEFPSTFAVVTENYNYTCSICKQPCKTQKILAKHAFRRHGVRPYKCEECQKRFMYKGHLKEHISLQHKFYRPFKCEVCDTGYSTKNLLRIHMRTHSGEKPYQCPICGLAFAISYQFRNHHRSHTSERPYVCEMCGKAFRWQCKLDVHMRSHTGEKPCKCPHCDAAFARTSTLRTHVQRAHTKNRPWKCRYCELSYRNCDARKAHERKIHENRDSTLC